MHEGRGTDRLLTLAEAAEQAGLSPVYLRRLASEGRLEAEKYGKTWVVRESTVESWTTVQRRRGRPKSTDRSTGVYSDRRR